MDASERSAAALFVVLVVLAALATAVVVQAVPVTSTPVVAEPDRDSGSDSDSAAQVDAIQAPSAVVQDRRWGPTGEQWRRALEDARALSLDAAAAQVIVPRWNSPDASALADMIARDGYGGVILMGDAVTTADAVAELTAAARQAAGGRPWGTLISTDQEGGTVARLRGIVPDLPSFMAAGAARDKGTVAGVYAQAGVDMRDLGITMDFAPVADVTIGLRDPIIRSRSAGSDADAVAATVVAAVDGYLRGGVAPVIKHFPGHGSVTADSHAVLPVQRSSLAQLEERDMVPFARAVDAGAPALMMGHLEVAAWGDGPASLAPAAYAYVRDELGFDGLIVTDALEMGAVTNDHDASAGEGAVAALAAGADVLLMPTQPAAARDAIVAAVQAGEIARERLDEAAARMIALQRWQRTLGPRVDTGDTYARDLAVAGATVAASECAAPFVGATVSVDGGTAADRARLTRALGQRGVAVVAAPAAADDPGGADASPPDATTVHLLGSDAASATADVVVALRGPWGLSGSSANVYVGLYGRSADAFEGLADVLTGAAKPGGDWPVSVDVPFAVCG